MVLAPHSGLSLGLRRAAYTSADVFAKERVRLGREGFAFVGRVTDLEAPGSFVAVEPWGERVVVFRGRDLELRAFVDNCVHRGVPLTKGSAGRLGPQGLACPYHGLRYTDDGCVRSEHKPLPVLSPFSKLSLPSRAVHVRFGNVFVSLGESARTFAAYENGAPPWLEASFHASLALAHRQRYRTHANWKLLVENFQESWHFPQVHAGLQERTPHGITTSVNLGQNWLGGTMKFERGTRTVAPSRTLGSRKFVAGAGWRNHVYDAYMFPLWLTSLQPDYFLTYRLIPLGPAETEVQADIWGHVASVTAKADREWSALAEFWERTNQEDRDIVERQMSGISSPSWDRMKLLVSEEQGIVAFNRRYASAMRDRGARR